MAMYLHLLVKLVLEWTGLHLLVEKKQLEAQLALLELSELLSEPL